MIKKKEEKVPKWIVDGNRVIFGPGQSYSVRSVWIFAIFLQVFGVLFVISTGSGILPFPKYAVTVCQLLGFAVFLFGIHIHKIARSALALTKKS